MPVSKTRKKSQSNKKKNNNINKANQTSLKNILYKKDCSLMEDYSVKDCISICEELLVSAKETFRDVPDMSEILYKKVVVINMLRQVYKKITIPEDDQALIIIEDSDNKCALRLTQFIHEMNNTFIIPEVTYITTSRNRGCIQPLTLITYLCDMLDIDLVFPSYITNDSQEHMFKSFGFIESDYPADEGQKILFRKSRRNLIDKIINIDGRLSLKEYFPLEDNRDNIYLKKFNGEYNLCQDVYNKKFDNFTSRIQNSSKDIYVMAQVIYNSATFGLENYTYKDAIADMRLESFGLEEIFKRIYSNYKNFSEEKYSRLYEYLLLHEKFDIICSVIREF